MKEANVKLGINSHLYFTGNLGPGSNLGRDTGWSSTETSLQDALSHN